MKRTHFIVAALLIATPAYAQDEKPLTGREYAANAIMQKENIIMQLLDQIVELKKQLAEAKKAKETPKP